MGPGDGEYISRTARSDGEDQSCCGATCATHQRVGATDAPGNERNRGRASWAAGFVSGRGAGQAGNTESKSAETTQPTPLGLRLFNVFIDRAQLCLQYLILDPKALEKIPAPALVLAGDHDIIRDEHTLEIYHHLPNGELCILPGAANAIPYDDPVLFNTTVEHFFQMPFVKKDRLNDLLKSLDALRKSNDVPSVRFFEG